MIRLAIIGDIGSGKSYVAKQFNYPVFNADTEVSKLYRNNRKCYKKLKKELPNYITTFPIKVGAVGRLAAILVKLNGVTANINPSRGRYSILLLVGGGEWIGWCF